jgi:uncharacterized protein YbjT (DUF2867 family)
LILVIGGHSKIGSALIKELVERRQPVRALARASENADPFPAGVETFVGDLGDVVSLDRAMEGSTRSSCCADRPQARSS